jgi:hypothetical protein
VLHLHTDTSAGGKEVRDVAGAVLCLLGRVSVYGIKIVPTKRAYSREMKINDYQKESN